MKKIVILIAVLIFTITLTACNRLPQIPDIDTIKADIEANGKNIVSSTLDISNVEIIETDLNEEDRSLAVDVEIRADDGSVTHLCFARIIYRYEGNKVWEYDKVVPVNNDEWKVTPLAGVNEDTVRDDVFNALMWQQFTIDDEVWFINDENIGSITVDSRNTQLEQGKETLTVTAEVNDELLVASGKLTVEYEFSEGRGWRFVDYKNDTPFSAAVRADAHLEVSDDEILNEVMQMKLPFLVGSSWNPETQQIISLAAEDVSGFALNNTDVSNKGTKVINEYTFSLDKGLIVFDVLINAEYNFTRVDGWKRNDLDVVLSVTSADIEGTTWVGEHVYQGATPIPPPRPITLEINEIASNGATFATLTYELENDTVIHEMRGSFDMETLSLDLKFHDWISTPLGRYSYNNYEYQRDLKVYIEADTLTMKYNLSYKNRSIHDATLTYVADPGE